MRSVTLLGAAALSLTLAACASSDSGPPPSHESQPPSHSSACTSGAVARGAATTLGIGATGGTAPTWSGRVGSAAVGVGDRLFAISSGGCVVALQGTTGARTWSWPAPRSSSVLGLTATPSVVLAALGETHGHAPAAVCSATDAVVGLDPDTGTQRWAVRLGSDGQGMPAVADGARVVVAEATGTVVGLDASSGTRRWSDGLPPGCTAAGTQGGLSPAANVLAAAPAATVLYRCADGQRLVRLDPATGATQWSWRVPAPWSVEYQSPAGSAAGVLGLLVSGHGPPLAPEKAAATQTPPGYQTDSLVAVGATTGRPLWQVTNVAGSAGVYGGGGRLCLVSGFGVTRYVAGTGTVAWQEDAPAVPTHGGPAGPAFTAAVADAGRLFLTVATTKARSVPTQSTTYRGPAGAFQLQVIDLASGRRLHTTPLPTFYGGPEQVVVSADSPPGVLAVTTGEVIVSPQLHETAVVEAWPRQ